MQIASARAPKFPASLESAPGAIDEVFALLHEIGLAADAQQRSGHDSRASETEALTVRIGEQLQALKQQRARLAELIESIDFAGV